MKRNTKFMMIFLLTVLLFTLMGTATAEISMAECDKTANETVIQLIAAIKTQYPDVNENEMIRILNNTSTPASESPIKEDLARYGISIDNTIYRNFQTRPIRVLAQTGMLLLAGVILFIIFTIYMTKIKKEIRTLTNYISEINNGDYHLPISENTEDENSVLNNEIYKTTVMLREQNETVMKEKVNLKNSISDISHQLKTPLTSIMIITDNLLDNEDMPAEVGRDFIKDIKKSAENISFLVQSLLTLSKLEANSIDFDMKKEKISDIFSVCKRNTEIIAEVREITLEITSDADLTLNCDKKWLSEAISNMVKNCIEHTPDGGKVTLTAEDKSTMFTCIRITDNGSGISQEELPHIFERFYKAKTSDESSVGIGLAIAKSIIEKHSGYIVTTSEVGKGTEFLIKFFPHLHEE